jgi:hypothetical protein
LNPPFSIPCLLYTRVSIAKLEAVHAAMITAGNDSGAGDIRILYATGAS